MPIVRRTRTQLKEAELTPKENAPLAAQERKVLVTLRFDREVVERWRATGPGWQTRVSKVLANAEPR
jgi:uncharacterized protein (DUF4415 family)